MKYIVSLLIILLAVGAAIGLYKTSPKTKKIMPKRPVPLVQSTEIHPGREMVVIEAFGTVVPAKRITLQSEVEGRIIGQNPELVPGGLINQDEMVIQVDPSDYELKVIEYRAEMEEAIFELDLEQGKQVIAEREWKLMEKEIDTSAAGKSLALREPHLRLVKAKVDKAKSRLAAAELALKRTMVQSPFNALVLEEFIDRGQLVSRQTSLATLAGTDQFWVQVSVPVSLLQRISLPGDNGKTGSKTEVIFESLRGPSVVRQGHVLRLMGDLDPEGRMARVLVVIDDPLNLQEGTGKGRLLLGSYVKVKIDAGYFDNVYSIPRQAMREGDVIWVQDNKDKLQIRNIDVVWRRQDEVLAHAGLQEGDRLILSRMQSPLPGMLVKSIAQSAKGIEKKPLNPLSKLVGIKTLN
ncbi:MAG: efflux RND transporter periplasmic adaptor subunit [Nitrospirota bacterium]